MDLLWWKQYLDVDLLTCRITASVEEKAWGYFVYNRDNPDHYDSNTARWWAPEVTDRELDELAMLYHGQGLDARLRLPDVREPAPAVARLEAKGFQTEIKPLRIMRWEKSPVAAPVVAPEVTVHHGTIEQVEQLAEVGLAANEWPGRAWFVNYLRYLLGSPYPRLYYAAVDGTPAAIVGLIQSEEAAIAENVATAPPYRRQGLAAALIQQVQSEATTSLFLGVEDEGAERIYRRAGFEVIRDIKEVEGYLPLAR